MKTFLTPRNSEKQNSNDITLKFLPISEQSEKLITHNQLKFVQIV